MPRDRLEWACRGRRERRGQGAGAEKRERESLVRWAHRDRKGEWGFPDHVATWGLRGLREGWGNRVQWARQAWGCLAPLDLPVSRGQLVLRDQGVTGGVVAFAEKRVSRVPRGSEVFEAKEHLAGQGRRGRRERRGLWEFPACPAEGILGYGDQRGPWACRAFPANTVTRAGLGKLDR